MRLNPLRWFGRKSTEWDAPGDPFKLWSMLLNPPAKSGVAVNHNSALRVSTVLACCRVLAEGIADMPLKLIVDDPTKEAKEPALDHPAYDLLQWQPNDWMTSFEFRETMMYHAVLAGAGRSLKHYVNGKLAELIPLVPANVAVKQKPDWSVVYQIKGADNVVVEVPKSEIFEVRGPSWDGVCPLDVVQQAREAIGLAIVTEESHARLHANGAQPGGILSFQGKLPPERIPAIKQAFHDAVGERENRFKTAVVDGGATWTPTQMNGVDAQHVAVRQLQIEEICRFFRVFPQMVGYADKTATFASAEAFFLAHVIHSLGPWMKRWEQAIKRDLLRGPDDSRFLVAKFSAEGLLRGDAKTRAELYSKLIPLGVYTPNEAREKEDRPKLPGLDEPLRPVNIMLAEDAPPSGEEPVDPVATAKQVVRLIRRAGIGRSGGPPMSDDELEAKVGRVLSAKNEQRIRDASGLLDEVLATLPEATEKDPADG